MVHPMAKLVVKFRYLTGLKRQIFTDARLSGSWDSQGRFSEVWTQTRMTSGRAEDGCPCFTATVELDDSGVGTAFRWGVTIDGPQGRTSGGFRPRSTT